MRYQRLLSKAQIQSASICLWMGLCLVCGLNAMPVFANETAVHAARSSSVEKRWSNPDKPGLFKIDQSTDDSVCRPLTKIINDDINQYGKTQFEGHTEFVKWQKVDEANIDRGEKNFDGEIEQATADINNDGIVDNLIRSKWLLRNVVRNDHIDVLPKNWTEKIIFNDLIQTDKSIELTGSYWRNRRIAKYGEGNYDWAFDIGAASINLYQKKEKSYVVAQESVPPSNSTSQIYVFRWDENYQPVDVCMLVKICPCGGCKYVGSYGSAKISPAKKWCGK